MLELKILVGEFLTIDGLATSAIAVGEITTLDHEGLDYTMESRSLIAKALLASGESAVTI